MKELGFRKKKCFHCRKHLSIFSGDQYLSQKNTKDIWTLFMNLKKIFSILYMIFLLDLDGDVCKIIVFFGNF